MNNLELYLTFALTWGILIAVFTGAGLLVYRLFGLKVRRVETLFLAFWTGWAFSIAVLQLWHFFAPVNDAIRLILSLAGLTGLGLHWRYVFQAFSEKVRQHPFWFIFAFIFMIWLANRSIGEVTNVDTGLYHLDVVRWSSTYKIVPGIANLHSRLGFSTGFFLYGALMNTGFWEGRVHHIANQALYLVMVLQLSVSLYYVFRKEGLKSYHYVAALFLPVVLHSLFFQFTESIVPTLTNDGAVYLIGVIILVELLRLIDQPELEASEAKFRVANIIFIASVGITAKYSFLVQAVGLSLLGVFIWLKRFDRIEIKSFLRLAIPLGIVAAFVLIPMMIRSVIFTGYPLYPLTLGAAHVEWRLPVEYAQSENDWIRAWARQADTHPDIVLANWDWLPGWWERKGDLDTVRVPINILVLSLCLFGLNWILLRRTRKQNLNMVRWWLLLPMIVALGYWFYSAPNPRFAGSLFWMIPFVIFVNALQIGRWQRLIFTLVFVTLATYPFQGFVATPWVQSADSESGIYPIPSPELETFVTDSNLTVYVPEDEAFCWGGTLPCTVYPDPDLALRVPGSLQDGFIMIEASDSP